MHPEKLGKNGSKRYCNGRPITRTMILKPGHQHYTRRPIHRLWRSQKLHYLHANRMKEELLLRINEAIRHKNKGYLRRKPPAHSDHEHTWKKSALTDRRDWTGLQLRLRYRSSQRSVNTVYAQPSLRTSPKFSSFVCQNLCYCTNVLVQKLQSPVPPKLQRSFHTKFSAALRPLGSMASN